MDLKGSLVDTNLRIYPSEKLINFVTTLQVGVDRPDNLFKFLKIESSKPIRKHKNEDTKPIIHLNNKDIEILNKIKATVSKLQNIQPIDSSESGSDICSEKDVLKENGTVTKDVPKEISEDEIKSGEEIPKEKDKGPYLATSDLDWLYVYLNKRRSIGEKVPYLHELLEGAHVELPENKIIKRNPILEARCVKLRSQQDARDYRKMTKGVDNVRIRFPEDSISYQLKQINRQLIAIGQFIISIFAGFLFGFKGIEWMIGSLDFGFRLLLGVMCALVIALAEIYFLAKKLSEELNVPETVQLGGPPKFADESKNNYTRSNLDKEHQD